MHEALHRVLHRLPGVTPGGSSLHRHLLLWLLLPQLVLWLAGAFFTYNLTARYANQAIDAALSTASRALARQVKPIGNGLFIDFPRAAQDIIEADPDDRVYYMVSTPPGQFILGNHRLPPPPPIDSPRLGQPYFYDGAMGEADAGLQVRVAALYLSYGEADTPQTMLVQVARSRLSQALLARQILADTVLPLSVLMLTMSALVWVGIRTGLAPLARLREAVSGRAPNDLAPIELRSAPSEVRDLAAALNTLLAAVHENVVKQRRFISDAAHQLRTPLAGLKGQAELALREATDPALRARLERVAQSATRSAHLITQLLTLARAEPESAATQGRSHFDLRRLVQELTAEQVPRALAQGVDLGLDEDGAQEAASPVCVEGNALLIREALANLIDNAIRYAGRDAVVTLRVRLLPGPASAPAWAEVEVDDNGPGLPAELHQQVFDRFVRVASDGNGCGLGLAIVQEIAQRHGGSARLESLQPRGLRAVLRLPVGNGGGLSLPAASQRSEA